MKTNRKADSNTENTKKSDGKITLKKIIGHFKTITRHRHRSEFLGLYIIIRPIFKMMSVSAFMMQPRRRLSVKCAFLFVRTPVSTVKPRARDKFRWAVL